MAQHAYIDFERWPGLQVPSSGAFQPRKSQKSQDRFQAICDEHELSVGTDQEVEVLDGVLFDRLSANGWNGLGESYIAQEWDSTDLVHVLSVFLQEQLSPKSFLGLRSKAPSWISHGSSSVFSGEIPPGLVELIGGETRTIGGALFSSGPRVSELAPQRVLTGGKPQKGRPQIPISISEAQAPLDPTLADLSEAQYRRINMMLDDAYVEAGERILEFPSTGGLLAIQAAKRGAQADILATDDQQAEALVARIRAAGLSGAVHVYVMNNRDPFSPSNFDGFYDAIFSVERIETLSPSAQKQFFRSCTSLLKKGGRLCVQTLVDNGLTEEDKKSLGFLNQYVWPDLNYSTVDGVVARSTDSLVPVSVFHFGAHYKACLPLWRQNLIAGDRDAAAAGFDSVYRKIWDYTFALQEALFSRDALDCVLITFVKS